MSRRRRACTLACAFRFVTAIAAEAPREAVPKRNPNMKAQFNSIAEHRDAPKDVVSGWINGVGIRAAYDF